MKFMLLIHQGDAPDAARSRGVGEPSPRKSRAPCSATTRRSTRRRESRPGQQLDEPGTAKTVRVEGGKTMKTDGPFAETKEALGGYLLFEADDIDAAAELAARIPAARLGGAVEVRPIVEW